MITEKKLIESVTISLYRYKELEKIEDAVKSGFSIIVRDGYYDRGKEYISLSESAAIKEISKEVLSVKNQLHDYKKLKEKLNYIENSFWFKLIKGFLNQLKYY